MSRQQLGQHYLQDQSVIEKIIRSTQSLLDKNPTSTLLEIGPGRGALTEGLKKICQITPVRKFTVIEKDNRLSQHWREQQFLEVISADFLELKTEEWLSPSLVVVSNLPYYAATAIWDRLSRQFRSISGLVLMFQAEVGKRLRAGPSQSGRGSLSVWSQNYWQVEKILSVSPGAFRPPPKVQSEVLGFLPRPNPMITGSEEHPELFEKMLKTAFAHRRKMLRSSLPSGLWQEALKESAVDPTLRAEALDWPQWQSFYSAVLKLSEKSS